MAENGLFLRKQESEFDRDEDSLPAVWMSGVKSRKTIKMIGAQIEIAVAKLKVATNAEKVDLKTDFL